MVRVIYRCKNCKRIKTGTAAFEHNLPMETWHDCGSGRRCRAVKIGVEKDWTATLIKAQKGETT